MKHFSAATPLYFMGHVLSHVGRYVLGSVLGIFLLLIALVALPLKGMVVVLGKPSFASEALKNIRTFFLGKILLPASSKDQELRVQQGWDNVQQGLDNVQQQLKELEGRLSDEGGQVDMLQKKSRLEKKKSSLEKRLEMMQPVSVDNNRLKDPTAFKPKQGSNGEAQEGTSLSLSLGGNGDRDFYDCNDNLNGRTVVLPHLGREDVGENTMESRASVYVSHIKKHVERLKDSEGLKTPIQVILKGHSIGGGIMSQVMRQLVEDKELNKGGDLEYQLNLDRTFKSFSEAIQQNVITGYGVLPKSFVRFIVDNVLSFSLPVEDNVRHLLDKGVTVKTTSSLVDNVLLGSAFTATGINNHGQYNLIRMVTSQGHNGPLNGDKQEDAPTGLVLHDGELFRKASRCIDVLLVGLALVLSPALSQWAIPLIATTAIGVAAAPIVVYAPVVLAMCYAFAVAIPCIVQLHAKYDNIANIMQQPEYDSGVGNNGKQLEKKIQDLKNTRAWLGYFSRSYALLSLLVGVITAAILITNPVGWTIASTLLFASCVGVGVTLVSGCVASMAVRMSATKEATKGYSSTASVGHVVRSANINSVQSANLKGKSWGDSYTQPLLGHKSAEESKYSSHSPIRRSVDVLGQ